MIVEKVHAEMVGAEEASASGPVAQRLRVNGIELAYFEWGRARRGAGPTLLLAHATGFHARCWDPVIRRLGDRHVIAVDQRGHGRSQKTEITHWQVFGRDLVDLIRALDLSDLVGVGHSMGGHAMVDAAAVEIDRFRERSPYRVFRPDALRAYCTHGLLPAADGDGFDLACSPEIEASVYMTSRTNAGVYDSVRALDVPVLILRAKRPPEDRDVMDFSSSPTWPGLVNEFRNAREIHFEDRTHFLPMEIPERVAELILEELACED